MITLILAIIASAKPVNAGNGRRLSYQGSCNTVKRLDMGLHLLINIMSTLILGGCSYVVHRLNISTLLYGMI
jgi:hypothetical protein